MCKMTNREITFAIKAAVITFILLFFGIKILFYGMLSNGWYEKRLTCGTVLGKSEQLKGKSVHVDYYLFMKFDNGESGCLNVSPLTHFSAKEGGIMCFDICKADYDQEPAYVQLIMVLGILVSLLGVIGCGITYVAICDIIKLKKHDKP